MNESQIEEMQQIKGEAVPSWRDVLAQEDANLCNLIAPEDWLDVAESLGRIEDAVKKRTAELEQAYAATLEVKCPHTLRRVVIDDLNERVGDLSDRLVEANGTIVGLEAQLADANKTIMALIRNASILDVSKKPF